jgi:hypothetical protein
MPCPYLTDENKCIAKPYGTEVHIPDQQSLENFCNNEEKMENCNRVLIYEAYLKSGGK